MRKCESCGVFNSDDSVFCTNCGRRFGTNITPQPTSSKSSKNHLKVVIGGILLLSGALALVVIFFSFSPDSPESVVVQAMEAAVNSDYKTADRYLHSQFKASLENTFEFWDWMTESGRVVGITVRNSGEKNSIAIVAFHPKFINFVSKQEAQRFKELKSKLPSVLGNMLLWSKNVRQGSNIAVLELIKEDGEWRIIGEPEVSFNFYHLANGDAQDRLPLVHQDQTLDKEQKPLIIMNKSEYGSFTLAWWVAMEFVPAYDQIRGIPVSQLNTKWIRALELRKDIIPKEYLFEGGQDNLAMRQADFVRKGDFNQDGIKDEALVGVYEDKDGNKGRFLIIATWQNKQWKKVFLDTIPGKAGFSVLAQGGTEDDIYVWYCLDCSAVNRFRWNMSESKFQRVIDESDDLYD